ncbi:hypothetical protein [Nostoc sp. MG11]|uniref:hypothetical protein n=1 Tax=Nostoc sp. MG11 TaxID=2721166 RepID=UPI0018661BCC|nr:hypothetical protein [Nostoc sp. MG11]
MSPAISKTNAHKKFVSMTDPQVIQTAINGATNAHTGLHQAIHDHYCKLLIGQSINQVNS